MEAIWFDSRLAGMDFADAALRASACGWPSRTASPAAPGHEGARYGNEDGRPTDTGSEAA